MSGRIENNSKSTRDKDGSEMRNNLNFSSPPLDIQTSLFSFARIPN